MTSLGARLLFVFIAPALLLLTPAGCSSGRSKNSAEVILNERMAAVLLREGRAVEAERAYRDVLPSDPRNPEVHDGLGVSLLIQGRYKDAYSSFDRAVDLDGEKTLYRIHRGMAAMEIGRFEQAESDFAAAEASPLPADRLDAAINRGRLKQRQKDFTAAEEAFTLALARDPKSPAAFIGRGIAREARGALEPAAQDYLDAVRLEPRNAEANLRLGLVLVSLKKDALGRKYLQRTIELDPNGGAGEKARLVLDGSPGSGLPRS